MSADATAIGLGMPAAPPPVLAPRRKTRQLQVGTVPVGSDHPVSVQSMTTTPTTDSSCGPTCIGVEALG